MKKTTHTRHIPSWEGTLQRHIRIFTIALVGIALLMGATLLLIEQLIRDYDQHGEIINLSGRQRMLSQRIMELAGNYEIEGLTAKLAELDHAKHRETEHMLREAIRNMSEAHQRLLTAGIGASHPSPTIHALYHEGPGAVDPMLQRFLAHASTFLELNNSGNPQQAMQHLRALEELGHRPLLEALDRVVDQYEVESAQSVWRVRVIIVTLLLGILAGMVAMGRLVFYPLFRQVRNQQEQLHEQASTDALTGCVNRRTLFEVGERELERLKRYGSRATVILLDIDHFKQVNDTYGHDVGDLTLSILAASTRTVIRKADAFGRVGGEEFAIVMPETGLAGGVELAEKLRELFAQISVPTCQGAMQFTASFGVAELETSDDEFATPMKRADLRLYHAKQSGRNQVCADTPTEYAR